MSNSTESPEVLSVGQLTAVLRGVVEQCFPDVWVAGEVSNCQKAGSGHIYFTLKDEEAQLKAILWKSAASRVKFELRDGMEVIANGPLEVYPARGQYQIICQRLQPQGIGSLELALRQLQEKLSAEGLFDPARKRPLPEFTRTIALVTSPTGAAVRDMLQILSRRWPLARVLLLPVLVQGDGAKEQIAAALKTVGRLPDVDVVICGRGGGSLEDLWAFNEEVVARGIAACPVPVVSAVGHEIDVTIADLVADRRALTPSEAAEIVVPSVEEIRVLLARQRERLTAALRNQARQARLTLDALAQRRCFLRPLDSLHERATRLDDLEARIVRAVQGLVSRNRAAVNALAGQLDALSPLGVLSRGYSLTKRLSDGRVLTRSDHVQPGDQISTLLEAGTILSTVETVIADE